jgi:hypothetical protein
VLHTPDIAGGALDGITRQTIITIAKDLGYEVVERRITRDEFILQMKRSLLVLRLKLHRSVNMMIVKLVKVVVARSRRLFKKHSLMPFKVKIQNMNTG